MTDHTAQTAETGDVETLRERIHKAVSLGIMAGNGEPGWNESIVEAVLAALAASPAPRAPAAGVPDRCGYTECAALGRTICEDCRPLAAAPADQGNSLEKRLEAALEDARDARYKAQCAEEDECDALGRAEEAEAEIVRLRAMIAAAPAAPPADGGTSGLREALERIANPILHMQREVPEGHKFDGQTARSLVTVEYLQSIARDAIAAQNQDRTDA